MKCSRCPGGLAGPGGGQSKTTVGGSLSPSRRSWIRAAHTGKGKIGYFLIAFLIFAIMSAGIVSILWAVFACSAIFFISSASVGALVWNLQSIPRSLHANVGIVFHRSHHLSFRYLWLFPNNRICKNPVPFGVAAFWPAGDAAQPEKRTRQKSPAIIMNAWVVRESPWMDPTGIFFPASISADPAPVTGRSIAIYPGSLAIHVPVSCFPG